MYSFDEYVLDYLTDDNGTISYKTAVLIVKEHSLYHEFLTEYVTINTNKINAQDLLHWLGY
jgi:hypothetical protein